MTDDQKIRNESICADYSAGHSVSWVARRYNMKRQRVQQILQAAGVWRPHKKTNRVHHVGVVVTEATKLALHKRAEETGTSVSKLAADALDQLVGTAVAEAE